MKKKIKMFLAFTVCALMLFAGMAISSVGVFAAAKTQGTIDLNKKALIIPKGKTQKIRNKKLTMVKGRRYDVKVKIKGKTYKLSTLPPTVGKAEVNMPAIAKIKNNMLIANKAGTATFRIIKDNKNLVTLKVKVIDITAHKHAWKNITKATCTSKGKELCKTCGLTNALPKTKHHYITDTCESTEGRGKKRIIDCSMYCSSCDWDMTDWTHSQYESHFYVDAMLEGKLSIGCGGGWYGYGGEERYEKYMRVKITETCCENCGAWDMDKTYHTDLYYCDRNGKKLPDGETDPWAQWSYENYLKVHGFILCPNCHDMSVMPGHACQVCKAIAPETLTETTIAKKAVDNPQDTITDVLDDTVPDIDAIISENETISDNSMTDNELNTDITDTDQSQVS